METKEKYLLTYKRMKLLLELIFLILLVIIIILLLRSCGRQPEKQTVLTPDYAVIPIDDGAKPMESTAPDAAVAKQGGGSVTISFQDNITYDTTTGYLTLFYQNPSSSTHNVAVRVVLLNGGEEYLLAESGLLEPGYEVSSLRIDRNAPTVSAGGYNALLRLVFYDRETGERANVDTDIPCTVTVK